MLFSSLHASLHLGDERSVKIALSIRLAFYPPWKNTPEISKGKTHIVNDNSKHDRLSLLETPGP